MKKCLLILFFLIFPFVPTQVLAELNNLMWAVFPVEKYEYMADKKTEKYMKDGQLKAIGRIYVSLERKEIIFYGLRTKDFVDGDSEFEFTYEDFKLKKVIKLDNENYTFEGIREGTFERFISGKIQLKKFPLAGKVVNFDMNELGEVYKGVMNRYIILSSEKGKLLKQKFKTIDFGNYYAAMSDDSITY